MAKASGATIIVTPSDIRLQYVRATRASYLISGKKQLIWTAKSPKPAHKRGTDVIGIASRHVNHSIALHLGN